MRGFWVGPEKVEPEKVGPEKVGPEKVGPEKVGPEKVGPEKSVQPQTDASGVATAGLGSERSTTTCRLIKLRSRDQPPVAVAAAWGRRSPRGRVGRPRGIAHGSTTVPLYELTGGV